MRPFRNFLNVLREHRRTYVLLNIAVYGLLGATMAVTALSPGLQERGLERAQAFMEPGPMDFVVTAYVNGDFVSAALGTFIFNLTFAALLTTTIPSLVIPFFGVAATVYRAIEIGMWLTPTSSDAAIALIPHAPVLIIEFQAYILATLGTIVLWRSTFGYQRLELPSKRAGYRAGLGVNLRLYPVIVLVLFVVAVFEAWEVIYLIPLLH